MATGSEDAFVTIRNHNSSTVTLVFNSTLNQNSCDEAFAIDNVRLRIKMEFFLSYMRFHFLF